MQNGDFSLFVLRLKTGRKTEGKQTIITANQVSRFLSRSLGWLLINWRLHLESKSSMDCYFANFSWWIGIVKGCSNIQVMIRLCQECTFSAISTERCALSPSYWFWKILGLPSFASPEAVLVTYRKEMKNSVLHLFISVAIDQSEMDAVR